MKNLLNLEVVNMDETKTNLIKEVQCLYDEDCVTRWMDKGRLRLRTWE